MSRFVSAGTTEEPAKREDEWYRAQQELDEARKRKEEESRQGGERTLYEVLQANKAAKQEAFEESIRLKNQFRSLDEDEVEFLDSVLESTRAKEAEIRKETKEQLESFRKQQEDAEKVALAEDKTGASQEQEEQWVVSGRKRKKGQDRELVKGVKLRKSSSTDERRTSVPTVEARLPPEKATESSKATTPTSASPLRTPHDTKQSSPTPGLASSSKLVNLGLGSYSSDEDD